MKNLAGQRVLVLGLGISGLALARWCARFGSTVTVADTREAPPHLSKLREAVPEARFTSGDLAALLAGDEQYDLILKSPGLSPAELAPVLTPAAERGIAVGNEVTLFMQALRELGEVAEVTDAQPEAPAVAEEIELRSEALEAAEAAEPVEEVVSQIQADDEESLPPPPPLIVPAPRYQPKVLAITGTNGKTTVTSLTGQLLQRAGKRVAVCGNIGPSLLDTLAECLDAQEQMRLKAEAESKAEAEQAALEQEQAAGVPAGSAADVELASEAVGPVGAPVASNQGQPTQGQPSPTHAETLPEVWVLELSSFQLEGITDFEPTAATVLNLSQDHLDWHGNMDAYGQAKANIFGQRGLMLLNRDDAAVMAMLPAPTKAPGKNPFKPKVQRAHQSFSISTPERPGDWGIETVNGMAWLVRAAQADETFKPRKGEDIPLYVQRLMPVDALHIRGLHNATNALAALALGAAAGCNIAPMLHGLRDYRGEPHRVESVAVVQDVEYFDDSKGTNVGATVAALKGLGASRQLVLILGGEGKGQNFSPLAEPISRHVRAVVLIGRDAPLIRAALADAGVALIDAETLPRAVEMAAARAQPGDAVLMSPACASFDMFDNYGHRGQVFCDAVRELALDAGVLA